MEKEWNGKLIWVKEEFLEDGEKNVPYVVLEDRGDRIVVQVHPAYRNRRQAIVPQFLWPKECCEVRQDLDSWKKSFASKA